MLDRKEVAPPNLGTPTEKAARVLLRETGARPAVRISDHKKPEVSDSILAKWQNLLDLIAKIMKVPAALIMRLDVETIEVFLRSASDRNPYAVGTKEALGSGLYCETAIATNGTLLVPNALQDRVWKDNPDTELGMLSYLGMPILWPDDQVFGTLCVLDDKENPYTGELVEVLGLMRLNIEADLRILTNKEELRRLSITDPLTGLFNRARAVEALEREFERYKRNKVVFSVIVIDLDHFKVINDQYGHLTGDTVLEEFASVLRENTRKTDLVARWGGEEFLILCPETNPDQCVRIAAKLRRVIERQDYSDGLRVTASMGIAAAKAEVPDHKGVVKLADDALREAKRRGRNRVLMAR